MIKIKRIGKVCAPQAHGFGEMRLKIYRVQIQQGQFLGRGLSAETI